MGEDSLNVRKTSQQETVGEKYFNWRKVSQQEKVSKWTISKR